jgi:hypothetical protein
MAILILRRTQDVGSTARNAEPIQLDKYHASWVA